MEVWKQIKGYEGLYEISSLGRLKSFLRNKEGRIISLHYVDGYAYTPKMSPTKKEFRIHRLVAEAFIPNPENKPEVDHIDRDRKNNNKDNLRWVTSKENKQNQQTTPGISGEINISLRYVVRCRKPECPLHRSCKTMEEAIEVRDQHFAKK